MAMTDGVAIQVGACELGDGGGGASIYVYYRVSQSKSLNNSTIYVGMYAEIFPRNGYQTEAWIDSLGSYVGVNGRTSSFKCNLPANTDGVYWLVENKSFTVNHNPDGTAPNATIQYKWGIEYNHDTFFYDINGSFDIELPSIDRLVKIVALPGTHYIGEKQSFIINNYSGLTYSLYYSIANDPKGYQLIVDKFNSSDFHFVVPPEALYYMEERDDWEVDITYKCETWEGNTLLGTTTYTQTYTPPFPSGVDIITSPIYIEREATIKISPKNNLFTHKLSWGLLGDGCYNPITEDKISDVIYDWELPGAEMYSLIGDTEKEAYFQICCETYYEDYFIGSITTSFKAKCDEALCRPKVYVGGVEDICNSQELTRDSHGTIIKGFNVLECNMSVEPQKGSYIVSMKIWSGDQVKECENITNPEARSSFYTTLRHIVEPVINYEATDSRGFTTIYKSYMNFVEHFRPTCSAEYSAELADDNTVSVAVSAKGIWFNGRFSKETGDGVMNDLTVAYRVSAKGQVITEWALIDDIIINGNNYQANTIITGLDYNKVHTIEIRANDLVFNMWPSEAYSTGYALAAPKSISIKPIFNWGEEDFTVNVNANFDQNIDLKKNNGAIWGYTKDGTRLNALTPVNGNNNLVLGWGSYDSEIGTTCLYGNNVSVVAKDKISVGSTLHLPSSKYFNTTDKTGGGLNANNSDIIGLNALVFQDACNLDNNEGINFPNGSNWDVLKGNGGNLYYMPNYPENTTASYNLTNNTVLWTGAYYMKEDQTATFTNNQTISKQPNGIVLVWSYYSGGKPKDSDFTYQFIPKYHATAFNGCGVYTSNATCGLCKYVLVYNDKIVGHTLNSGTGTRNNLTYNNNNWVLRAVIGV